MINEINDNIAITETNKKNAHFNIICYREPRIMGTKSIKKSNAIVSRFRHHQCRDAGCDNIQRRKAICNLNLKMRMLII